VKTAGLNRIAAMLQRDTLRTTVGAVLPLANARSAHEMLEHPRGKIVLRIGN
jgi:NADPH:quinone reductase-like Zn-dependent oxidoreductase